MNKLLSFLLLFLLVGCATVDRSDAGGRSMVMITNSSWYLFNLIPIASGNPESFNKFSCKFFTETATLESNIRILDKVVEESGAKSVKSLKSFWDDESVFVIFMKRHVVHTSAELIFEEDDKESKSDDNNKSDSKS